MSHSPERPIRLSRRVGRVVASALIAIVAVTLVESVGVGAWLYVKGWRITTVATPSMSPKIPVGALVITRPLSSPAEIGQVIVFRPPGDSHDYIHRVVARGAGPTYRTKGDNDLQADPWVISARQVVGGVAAVTPDLGWLVLGAPMLGAALILGAVLGLAFPRWRHWAILDCLCAGLLAISLRLHPFVRWQVVTTTHYKGKSRTWLFDTGILPIRARIAPGTSLNIEPGHSAILTTSDPRQAVLGVAPDLTRAEWVIAIGVCALPIVASLVAVTVALVQQRRQQARWTKEPALTTQQPQPATATATAAPVATSAAPPSDELARSTSPAANYGNEPCGCPSGPCWFDGACRWSTHHEEPTLPAQATTTPEAPDAAEPMWVSVYADEVVPRELVSSGTPRS